MKEKGQASAMERVATFIVDKRRIFFLIFAAACIFCAVSRNWVDVCDDITRYLSEETETRQGIDLMDREFTTFGTGQVMVANVSYPEAQKLAEKIEELEGVRSVAFDGTEKHYNHASALFDVTFAGEVLDQVSVDGMNRVKELLKDYDLYINSPVGNPLDEVIDREMLVVDAIAVVIILLVLLLTSKTYAEIPVLLITFGAAALLNMGTNFLMGSVSFVTNSIAIVMQLALAIDYAIILCHRYTEEREQNEPREAAIKALSYAIPEISASSLTTISGLLALCLMEFKLGYDMGSVLIKSILCSMFSVFLLMPGLLVVFSKAMDKSHHKSFVPKISFLGHWAYATRYIMPPVFLLLAVGAFYFSGKDNYVYDSNSISSIRQNETQIAKQQIEDCFATENTIALVFPSGDYDKEAKMIEEIQELPRVTSVTGLANTELMDGYTLTSALTPREFSQIADLDVEVAQLLFTSYAVDKGEYGQIVTNMDNYEVPLIDMFDHLFEQRAQVELGLDEDTEELLDEMETQLKEAKMQLMSPDYSRIVITLDLPIEGEESYQYLDVLHGIAARQYQEYYLVGDSTNCSDLRDSFEKDNILISILTVVFVVTVLIFTFKSGGLSILLIAIIQGSIWCNFSIPYLQDKNLFFMSYLIVSSIQMGANIDYAIVISSRYLELKERLPLKEAMVETLNLAFPTIITSGSMMALAGFAIGLLSSNEIICSIGVFLGTGTTISILMVMCMLPQILLLGDMIIRKTSFEIPRSREMARKTGTMRLDGRVRGRIEGLIDAEVHGVFRGQLNAIVDVGGMEHQHDEMDEKELEEGKKE